jgi:hypothetical protein
MKQVAKCEVLRAIRDFLSFIKNRFGKLPGLPVVLLYGLQIHHRGRVPNADILCYGLLSVTAPFGHDITRARWAVESKGEELTAESMVASSIRP